MTSSPNEKKVLQDTPRVKAEPDEGLQSPGSHSLSSENQKSHETYKESSTVSNANIRHEDRRKDDSETPEVKRPKIEALRKFSIPVAPTDIEIPLEMRDRLPSISVPESIDTGMSDVDRFFSENVGRYETQTQTSAPDSVEISHQLPQSFETIEDPPKGSTYDQSTETEINKVSVDAPAPSEARMSKIEPESSPDSHHVNSQPIEDTEQISPSNEATTSPSPSVHKACDSDISDRNTNPAIKEEDSTHKVGAQSGVSSGLNQKPATNGANNQQQTSTYRSMQKSSRLVVIYDKPRYYHMIMQLNELRSNPLETVAVVELAEIIRLIKDPIISTTRYDHLNICIEYNENFKSNLKKFIDFIEQNTGTFERFGDINYHIQFAPDKKWKHDYTDEEKAAYKNFIETLSKAFGDKIIHCSIINKYDMDTVYLTERSDLANLGQEIQDDIIHWKNLKVLDYGESSIRFLPGVKLPESLEVLNIGGGYALETLTGFKMPSNLRTLLASQNAVHSIDNLSFPATLERLELSDNKIYFLNQVELPPRLEHLDVSQNRIESLRGVNFPRTLKSLNLGFNPIESIKGVKFPEGLVLLDISNIPNESMTGVKFPDSIEVLNLQASMTNTRGLKLPNTLKKLIMADNGVNSINPLKLPDSIEVLYLNNNNIKTLNKVHFPTNLKELYLGANLITTLKNVTFPPSLEVLDIEMDPDYDEHEKHITTLRDLTFPENLKVLKLGYHSIKVIESIDFPLSLVMLSLAYNELKFIKNVRLGNCLKTLDISGNQELTNIDGFLIPESVTELRIPPELIPNLPGYIIERANRKQLLLKKSLPY